MSVSTLFNIPIASWCLGLETERSVSGILGPVGYGENPFEDILLVCSVFSLMIVQNRIS
jgi:hypothetical protein